MSPPDHAKKGDATSPPPCGEDAYHLRAARDEALLAAQAAVRDTTNLTRLLTILSEPAPLTVLLDRVLSTLSELFSADVVVLLDPAGTGSFSPLAAVGLPEDMIHQPMSDAEDGYVAAAMRKREPVLLASGAGADPRVDAQLRELGVETAVWLPVTDSHEAMGALILARCRPVPFSDAEVGLLRAMAYRIGLTLDQAQRSVQLEQIVRTGREIARHLDQSAVCEEAVRMFPALVGADAAVLVLNDLGGTPRCAAQIGLDPSWASAFCHIMEQFLTEPRLASDDPYSTRDLRAAVEPLAFELPDLCPARALLAVPIRRDERTQGLLCAMRFLSTSFSSDSLQVALLYAGQISAALENARLYRAVCDELGERVRAEAQREQLEARLRHAQKMEAIGTFAGGIAHDFNNLLGAIIGNIELARLDIRSDKQSITAMDSALQAATQAADLTRKFITFATGGHPAKMAAAAKGLITEAVSLSLSGSAVRAEYCLPDDLWEIEIDQMQIKQSLSNIAINAAEAMPGGGTIRVTAENVEINPPAEADGPAVSEGRYVKLVISDQGKGIPPENLARIFDPYFSTKARGTEKGMGLGLAIAHSIITRHRGFIYAESQPGVGTAFHVYLPASETDRGSAPTDSPGRCARVRDKRRLLLMEDEAALAQMTIKMLNRLGYEDVEHAWGGDEAVERFKRAMESDSPFDLVILDLTIKGGTGGKETVKKLLEMDQNLRAIVTSGYANDPVMSQYADHGFCASLHKPFGMRDLREAMEAAMALQC
jgi:signal transduction histidine kinase/ActR/RegA family two-component response regulator